MAKLTSATVSSIKTLAGTHSDYQKLPGAPAKKSEINRDFVTLVNQYDAVLSTKFDLDNPAAAKGNRNTSENIIPNSNRAALYLACCNRKIPTMWINEKNPASGFRMGVRSKK